MERGREAEAEEKRKKRMCIRFLSSSKDLQQDRSLYSEGTMKKSVSKR